MSAEQLRCALVAVLAAADGPLTTTAARLAVGALPDTRERAAVAEEVYRALVVLERRGVVRRVLDQPGRLVRWELAMLFGDTACGARDDRQCAR